MTSNKIKIKKLSSQDWDKLRDKLSMGGYLLDYDLRERKDGFLDVAVELEPSDLTNEILNLLRYQRVSLFLEKFDGNRQ